LVRVLIFCCFCPLKSSTPLHRNKEREVSVLRSNTSPFHRPSTAVVLVAFFFPFPFTSPFSAPRRWITITAACTRRSIQMPRTSSLCKYGKEKKRTQDERTMQPKGRRTLMRWLALCGAQVKNVAEMGAYVSLLEYNGIEGKETNFMTQSQQHSAGEGFRS
jgi:hypothetical protein